MRLVPIAAIVAAAACRPAAAPSSAVDVNVDLVVGKSIEAAPAERTCVAYLKADRISKSMSTCILDEQVSQNVGKLEFPCDGSGEAQAVFGEHRYRGRLDGNKLALALETELDWTDGCRWETHHAIRGTLARSPNGNAEGSLSWRYADHPASGESCSGACTADARIAVTATKPDDVAPEPEEEEIDVDP